MSYSTPAELCARDGAFSQPGHPDARDRLHVLTVSQFLDCLEWSEFSLKQVQKQYGVKEWQAEQRSREEATGCRNREKFWRR